MRVVITRRDPGPRRGRGWSSNRIRRRAFPLARTDLGDLWRYNAGKFCSGGKVDAFCAWRSSSGATTRRARRLPRRVVERNLLLVRTQTGVSPRTSRNLPNPGAHSLLSLHPACPQAACRGRRTRQSHKPLVCMARFGKVCKSGSVLEGTVAGRKTREGNGEVCADYGSLA